MIILRTIIMGIFLLVFIMYISFVLVTSDPCKRIDRATIPVRLGSEFLKTMVEPWTSPQFLQTIDQSSARTRIRLAILFRIQFYSDVNPPVVCDWDMYKEQVLGPDNSLIQKERNQNQQNNESQNQLPQLPSQDKQ